MVRLQKYQISQSFSNQNLHVKRRYQSYHRRDFSFILVLQVRHSPYFLLVISCIWISSFSQQARAWVWLLWFVAMVAPWIWISIMDFDSKYISRYHRLQTLWYTTSIHHMKFHPRHRWSRHFSLHLIFLGSSYCYYRLIRSI